MSAGQASPVDSNGSSRLLHTLAGKALLWTPRPLLECVLAGTLRILSTILRISPATARVHLQRLIGKLMEQQHEIASNATLAGIRWQQLWLVYGKAVCPAWLWKRLHQQPVLHNSGHLHAVSIEHTSMARGTITQWMNSLPLQQLTSATSVGKGSSASKSSLGAAKETGSLFSVSSHQPAPHADMATIETPPSPARSTDDAHLSRRKQKQQQRLQKKRATRHPNTAAAVGKQV